MSTDFLTTIDTETQSIFSAEFSELFEIVEIGKDDISGIFDKTYETVDAEGVPIISQNPRISFHRSSIEEEVLSTIKQGDHVTIRSTNYVIDEIDDTNEGEIVTIYLKNE